MSQENDQEREEDTQEETQEEEVEEQEEEEEEESSEEDYKSLYQQEKERREKAEQTIAQQKKRSKKKKLEADDDGEGDGDLRQEVESLKQTEKKRDFGYQHNLSPEEVDKVFAIESNPTEDTLNDPFVKEGLKGIRKQKKVSENTPSSSGQSSPLKKKGWNELSRNEKNKRWQEHMRKRGVIS